MKLRAVATVMLAGSLALGLSACNFISPQRTLQKYDPSDGVGADLGGLDVRNVLLITEDGESATLVMSVINTSTDDRTLEVQYESSAAEAVAGKVNFDIDVAGQSIVSTSPAGEKQIVLQGIDSPAGALFSVYFQTGDSQGVDLPVPVLDATLEQYANLAPSPTPTPTPTPAPVVPAPVATVAPDTEAVIPDDTPAE
ncbi:DNA modification methylase [Amnibacterium flavum]|uniref:DNA modification methylase n=1 Tax=Amnibacterium flavum TaxID=2173173 RepID=A0A2V1HQS2_9MICO|nr:DNA modification methylase [Amnibacterium flavum]PVZ94966.1 DNA modification methylase [Amnibacterium flavum]